MRPDAPTRRERRWTGRAAYALDRFLSAGPILQLAALAALGFAIAFAFAIAAWIAVPSDPVVGSPGEALWWSLNRMLDGGNVASDSGASRRVLGVGATMSGIVFVAAMTAAIVSFV